jgi:hypothetical protein
MVFEQGLYIQYLFNPHARAHGERAMTNDILFLKTITAEVQDEALEHLQVKKFFPHWTQLCQELPFNKS